MRVIYCNKVPPNCILANINLKNPFLDIKSLAKSGISLDATHLPDHVAFSLVLATYKHSYQLTKYKSYDRKKNDSIVVYVRSSRVALSWRARLLAHSFGNRLASEPANKLFPSMFCKVVQRKLAKYGKHTVACYDEKWLMRHGLNLVLSVGQSSTIHPPRFLVVEVGTGSKTICIIGKGVIFDSGGYNLKSKIGLEDMKHDKTGGAISAAIAVFFAQNPELLSTRLKIVVIVPLVENLIGQTAQKVGDIHTAYNGNTVEVLNTDAEGRLILADALAYACNVFKPSLLIDFATLTGWAGTLHCDTSYVYYTQNDKLARFMDTYGALVGERSIRMPNWPEYAALTRSSIADYKNFDFKACPKSGGFMAAMFLSNFIKDEYKDRWIHIDITHVENHKGMNNCNGLQTVLEMILKMK